tara:strand:- start:508 stop:915 length:408 start_codon:yes stop_codon:yes gene_type:complete
MAQKNRQHELYEKLDEVVSHLMDHQPEPGSAEEALLMAMSEYMHGHEQTHYPMPECEVKPVDVIAFQLDRLGWTQAELARRAQIQPTHLSSVLSGKRTLSLTQAKKLAVLFGVPLDRLIPNEFKAQLEPARVTDL